jgi:hypothetical protein
MKDWRYASSLDEDIYEIRRANLKKIEALAYAVCPSGKYWVCKFTC